MYVSAQTEESVTSKENDTCDPHPHNVKQPSSDKTCSLLKQPSEGAGEQDEIRRRPKLNLCHCTNAQRKPGTVLLALKRNSLRGMYLYSAYNQLQMGTNPSFKLLHLVM